MGSCVEDAHVLAQVRTIQRALSNTDRLIAQLSDAQFDTYYLRVMELKKKADEAYARVKARADRAALQRADISKRVRHMRIELAALRAKRTSHHGKIVEKVKHIKEMEADIARMEQVTHTHTTPARHTAARGLEEQQR